MRKEFYDIFKSGSKTYFNSSIFFPKEIREKVFVLYAFVRCADNFVDIIPAQKKEFFQFKSEYEKALKGEKVKNPIILEFVRLMQKEKLDPAWVEAFSRSMEMDLDKKTYLNMDETIGYMYGSAEVIGLMLAKILNLPPEAFESARYLGRAMQYINFIRDIKEDQALGRTYLPQNELKASGLNSLAYNAIASHKEQFKQFIQEQINRHYKKWQFQAEQGYKFIPYRYLIPIKTASDMYLWTAEQIYKDPLVIYKKAVKPAKIRIFAQVLFNFFSKIYLR